MWVSLWALNELILRMHIQNFQVGLHAESGFHAKWEGGELSLLIAQIYAPVFVTCWLVSEMCMSVCSPQQKQLEVPIYVWGF